MQHSGLLITLEGPEEIVRSQLKLLAERLKAVGYEVIIPTFPQLDRQSSYFIQQYLAGSYGDTATLGPYLPSIFYALDRFDNTATLNQNLAEGKVVLTSNYTGANMVRQAGLLAEPNQQKELFNWLDGLEFGLLHIPRPDSMILLAAEIDRHLLAIYQLLKQTYPDNSELINYASNQAQLTIPAINNLIWERIEPMLKKLRKKTPPATKPSAQEVFAPEPAANPYVQKNDNGSYSITEAGSQYLADTVTNTDRSVYAFTDKLPVATVAAAMARLSRRGDDMRVTILDEFSETAGKDEALLRRVITAYGDDSVQQLSGIHVVVENASNLLTKKLEWGRLAAYLEQSTRYIFFDQKDAAGRYKFYIPTTLDEPTTKLYTSKLNQLFDTYSKLVRKVTEYVRKNSSEPADKRDGAWKAATRAQACDAIRPVLPVATQSTVGIYANGQALESLIMHLMSEEFDEAQTTGQALLAEARKVMPTFLERADKPDRGGAWVAYRATSRSKLAQLSQQHQLQPIKGNGNQAVHLTNYWPKNELELLPHMLYEQSTLSLAELEQTISQWSYDDKQAAFSTYIGERLNRRHKPGRAMEIAHYSFDIICDYGIFRDLQRHRMVDSLEWQALSPHYGYEIPELVSQAGAEELFESCFQLSFELYQALWEKGYQIEAQYATLLGHKMRWKFTLNAREAFHFVELRTSPQGHPGYRQLAKQIYDKISEVHPLTAAAMRFVNQGEDPELTRLATERATQFKLSQLEN